MPNDLQEAISRRLRYSLGKDRASASDFDLYQAVGLAVRDYLIDGAIQTEKRYQSADAKRLYYLSMEFLVGRSLGNNLLNLGLFDECRDALQAMGADLEELREWEPDAALGNGGLGRLAACFLDSLATLGMPGYGYGINYEYGLFRQRIENGYQREEPDNWLTQGTPWQIERPDEACIVPVYGRVDYTEDGPQWRDWKPLVGVPHDMPIVGYGGRTVNNLRLFSARSSADFDMQVFSDGDYHAAIGQKIASESISKVLYPSDIAAAGKELRLLQEYFLVSCALRDIVRDYLKTESTFDEFPRKVAIQLNDTHPALTVAELMRVLMDENHHLGWDAAWEITQATLGYTNHTLLPEALERWSVGLLEQVLPRHLQIIYEINHRFLELVEKKWPGDMGRVSRLSIIEEGAHKSVRMANLAIVGSHSVNGVSALHTDLIERSLVPDFYQLWPEKFNNKTNGVTQRRWLLKANPGLAALVTKTVGDDWITDLDRLRALESFTEDAGFRQAFLDVKHQNKVRLAAVIADALNLTVDPASLFDVQVKRMHEYKRQLLNVLQIIHAYLALVEDGVEPTVPRTFVFAGKASPGYWAAKQTIKLINNVARTVNDDKRARDLLRVVFLPDYRVSLAEKIIPAADLSEQISTAGKEASGTGNMKFMLNGALTIGTLDGANVEMSEEAGLENIFIFGLRAEEIHDMRARGAYRPWEYAAQPGIRRVLDALKSDLFCPQEPGLFRWVHDMLLHHDEYFHLADMPSYIESQRLAGLEYAQPETWVRKAILNVARVGKFSSDRTIREYASDIWDIKTV